MNESAHPLLTAGTALFDALASGWPCVWMGAVPWLSTELLDARDAQSIDDLKHRKETDHGQRLS